MNLSCENLERANQLAQFFNPSIRCDYNQTSRSWFDYQQGIAFWANDPSKKAGTISSQLAQELQRFLDQVILNNISRLVLFIDSAGVSLQQGWPGMQHTAALIKQLQRINISNNITTIAVSGEEFGCYGGAYLIASSCQYVLASRKSNCGVSGPKVIKKVIGTTCHLPADQGHQFYQASYRVLNKELFCLLPKQILECKTLISMLSPRQLSLASIKADIAELNRDALVDQSWLPAPESHKQSLAPNNRTSPLGFQQSTLVDCNALLQFINQLALYLENGKPIPLIRGNCIQDFSFLNEQRGFSRYLATCIKLIRFISETEQLITIEVDGIGTGASFIALSMMADQLILKDTCRIYPLPPEVVHMFLPENKLNGKEWQVDEACSSVLSNHSANDPANN